MQLVQLPTGRPAAALLSKHSSLFAGPPPPPCSLHNRRRGARHRRALPLTHKVRVNFYGRHSKSCRFEKDADRADADALAEPRHNTARDDDVFHGWMRRASSLQDRLPRSTESKLSGLAKLSCTREEGCCSEPQLVKLRKFDFRDACYRAVPTCFPRGPSDKQAKATCCNEWERASL
jgi:hypothetical protein